MKYNLNIKLVNFKFYFRSNIYLNGCLIKGSILHILYELWQLQSLEYIKNQRGRNVLSQL